MTMHLGVKCAALEDNCNSVGLNGGGGGGVLQQAAGEGQAGGTSTGKLTQDLCHCHHLIMVVQSEITDSQI